MMRDSHIGLRLVAWADFCIQFDRLRLIRILTIFFSSNLVAASPPSLTIWGQCHWIFGLFYLGQKTLGPLINRQTKFRNFFL